MSQQRHAGGDLLILLLDVPLLAETGPSSGAGPAASTPGSAWATAQQSQQGTSSLLEQVLYFMSAYMMMSDDNRMAVFGLMPHACELLYLSPTGSGAPDPSSTAQTSDAHGGSTHPTKSVHARLMELVHQHAHMLQLPPNSSGGQQAQQQPQLARRRTPLALSAGLSRALCLIQRLHGNAGSAANALSDLAGGGGPEANEHVGPSPHLAGAGVRGGPRPRILCLVAAPDAQQQYVATMNTIFSAQRAGVAIDTLMVGAAGGGGVSSSSSAGGGQSVYLQQAAHLTGGLYVQAAAPGGKGAASLHGGGGGGLAAGPSILQHLLSCMAPDLATRSMMRVHQPLGVDFRASCFCHKRPVDVGSVCSVCLSIFCEPLPECPTCGVRFLLGAAAGVSGGGAGGGAGGALT